MVKKISFPQAYLTSIVSGLVKLQKESHLRIVRFGTRLPVHNPLALQEWHYSLLAQVNNPYLMVHINHPAELSEQNLQVLTNFRKKANATVLSQTVLLKDMNDNTEILYQLFVKMAEEGIQPYYVFQNDPVFWARHFTVPIKKAIRIWQRLRPRLSGLAACARLVIDTSFGAGKIPIPEGEAWEVDYSHFFDFNKQKHPLK